MKRLLIFLLFCSAGLLFAGKIIVKANPLFEQRIMKSSDINKKIKNDIKSLVKLLEQASQEKLKLYMNMYAYDSFNGPSCSLTIRTTPECVSLSASLDPQEISGKRKLSLYDFEVIKDYRNKGIGLACIKFLRNTEIAQMLGYATIELTVKK